MNQKASTTLSICIVGGGIGGLAVSILLAQSGHDVVVLERRDADYEGRSTGGISLTYNSLRVIEQMGLEDEVASIADQGYPIRMRYDSLEVLSVAKRSRPFFMVHRADVSKMLSDRALKVGVTIHFQARVASILDGPDQVNVKLEDGIVFTSDVLIGADGIDSDVRRTVFPNISPRVTSSTVMLVNIPKSIMESERGTAELYNTPPLHTPWGPGLSIVSWAMTKRQVYHLQMCDYEYGTGEPHFPYDPPEAPYITTLTDSKSLQALRQRWSIFAPSIRRICDAATAYTKWKIVELPPLPSYSSTSCRIVLLGDAAHAIKPFAGQGANMAIEDGCAISTLLSLIPSKRELPSAISMYDKVRIPRLAKLRDIIESNVKLFGMRDSAEHREGDMDLNPTDAVQSEEETKKAQKEKMMQQAANYSWIMDYDTETETRKVWSEHQSKEGIGARM